MSKTNLWTVTAVCAVAVGTAAVFATEPAESLPRPVTQLPNSLLFVKRFMWATVSPRRLWWVIVYSPWPTAYACGGGTIKVIELQTGKITAELLKVGGSIPFNAGWNQVMEDTVISRVDGSHGGISAGIYRIDAAGQIKQLPPKPWGPPIGGHTTGYHCPTPYPLVDGRIFIRQYDGIYCWDSRKK